MQENERIRARIAKQGFLHEEIIEKGYNGELFLEYCEKLKSSDIDEWEFDELRICVNDFQQESQKNLENKSEKALKTIENPGKNIENPGKTAEKILKTIENTSKPTEKPSKDKEFSEIQLIKGEKVQVNVLSSLSNIKILVCNPELIDPGLFSSKYYEFVVNTQPINWIVKRRIDEFIWLREVLVATYYGIYVPPLTKSGKNKTEPKSVFKKIFFFKAFLNNIVGNQLLLTSPYLLAFLQENSLKNTIKNCKKLKTLKSPSEILSISGEIPCIYTESTDHFSSAHIYLSKSEKLLSDLQSQLKILICDYLKCSDSIQNYSKILFELKSLNDTISNTLASEIFAELKTCLENWSNFLQTSTKNIYEDLKVPLSFYKAELSAFKSLLKDRESALSSYNSNMYKANSLTAKVLFGYYNASCLDVMEKSFPSFVQELSARLSQSFALKSSASVDFHLVWGSLIAILTSILV